MPITNWTQLLDAFPIREQPKIDDAAGFLQLQLRNNPQDRRARAWLGYTAITAAVDRWSTAKAVWGSLQNQAGAQLRGSALTLVTVAFTGMPAGYADAYDVWWAAGFVSLHNSQHAQARQQWGKAYLANQTRQVRHLWVECADACVLFGAIDAPSDFNAALLINLAFDGYTGVPPAWFYWVKAWVLVAQAAQFAPGSADRRRLGNDALAAYREMPVASGTGLPFDFDAAIVKMLANFCVNSTQDLTTWAQLNAVVTVRKPHLATGGSACWGLAQEIAREPFLPGNTPATNVSRLLAAALPSC